MVLHYPAQYKLKIPADLEAINQHANQWRQ
jgi:hypothetical protein